MRNNRRKTTEEYVKEAQAIHPHLDYSLASYVSAHAKIRIKCHVHGVFEQAAGQHLYSKGCPSCAHESTVKALSKTPEQFLLDARRVHGDLYSYRDIKEATADTKIIVVCKKHNDFIQTVRIHLRGGGCPKCASEARGLSKRKTYEDFLLEASSAHGVRYDYSKSEFTTSTNKISIECRIHGTFYQRPSAHVRGQGCPQCGDIRTATNRTLTTEDFLEKAKLVHGDKYDYSRTVYTKGHEKLSIICPDHGSFDQTANDHINQGSGCAKCTKQGFNTAKAANLYLLVADEIIKIGITNRDVSERLSKINRDSPYNFKVSSTWQMIGEDAVKVESTVLNELRLRYQSPTYKFDGFTECFLGACLIDVRQIIEETITMCSA